VNELLGAIANTHEHLKEDHLTLSGKHKEVLFACVYYLCAAITKVLDTKDGFASLPTRSVLNPLYSLAKMRIYNKDLFLRASELIADRMSKLSPDTKLHTDAQMINSIDLGQWLRACFVVQHSVNEHTGLIHRMPPRLLISDTDSARHVLLLANDLNELHSPDPSLSYAIDRLNTLLAGGDLRSLGSAQPIYGLHELCVLTKEENRTKAVISQDIRQSVRKSVEGAPRSVIKPSRMEEQFLAALKESGLPISNLQTGAFSKASLSCDALCMYGPHQRLFFEFNGPAHYCVHPHDRLQGFTVRKKRLMNALGEQVIHVPYFEAFDSESRIKPEQLRRYVESEVSKLSSDRIS
jgi:hypothetical protein